MVQHLYKMEHSAAEQKENRSKGRKVLKRRGISLEYINITDENAVQFIQDFEPTCVILAFCHSDISKVNFILASNGIYDTLEKNNSENQEKKIIPIKVFPSLKSVLEEPEKEKILKIKVHTHEVELKLKMKMNGVRFGKRESELKKQHHHELSTNINENELEKDKHFLTFNEKLTIPYLNFMLSEEVAETFVDKTLQNAKYFVLAGRQQMACCMIRYHT